MRGETQTIMKKKTQLLWIKLNKRVKHLMKTKTDIVLTYTFEFWKLLFRSEFEQFLIIHWRKRNILITIILRKLAEKQRKKILLAVALVVVYEQKSKISKEHTNTNTKQVELWYWSLGRTSFSFVRKSEYMPNRVDFSSCCDSVLRLKHKKKLIKEQKLVNSSEKHYVLYLQ